ncbi:PREDICTED: gamma-glutamyltransferase 6 [Elephantulus edwardii]|uniref:gamma-glutamyltransferase 6 n=1 Tax=Elephantulus edwardii TaxID=28737 RepID=UPI0003F0B59C|nr:PREDICTED: gamma-glutamyltransferase 6 [Elephantulus edwardii]
MEPGNETVHYQKLLLSESALESDEEEVKASGLLVPKPWRTQKATEYKVSGSPGFWPQMAAALLLLTIGFFLAIKHFQADDICPGSLKTMVPPPTRHSHSPGTYHHGAIISSAAACSSLGRELLESGGNIVDAGVGAALCLSVVHPHATGLGAMFWGLFYNSSSGNSSSLTSGPIQTVAPGLGLPAALPTLHLLHARFGHLPWPRLLGGPTTLAQEGFLVDKLLASALAIQGTKGLCPLLCSADGTPLGLGARVTNPKLAAVLREAALAPSPDLTRDVLLGLMARDLGLEALPAEPVPSLVPALQLSVPQGILFTTPGPSAGPELLALLEAALSPGGPSPEPCPPALQAVGTPRSSILAAIDSSGSMLLLISSLNSSFGSGQLSPSTGVLFSDLVAHSAGSPWACPLILQRGSDDTEADVVGLVASEDPMVARAVTSAMVAHLAVPQTQTHHHHHGHQQGPIDSLNACVQGTLLQVTAHAEHAHVSSIPAGCCPFQGF